MPVQRRHARASRSPRGARASSSRRGSRTPSPDSAPPSARMKRSRVTLAITEAAAIAALVASPPTTGRCSKPVAGTGKPSRQAEAARRPPTRRSTSRQRREVRHVQPALVDPAHAARRHRDLGGDPQDARVELLAPLLGVLLGVVQRGQRPQVGQPDPLVVEQHRGGHQRPGQAAAPGLVGAGHEAAPERAVVGEQAAAAPTSLAGSPHAPGFLPTSEEPDALGRPVGREGGADDPLRGTGPQNRLSSDDPRLSPIMK